MQISLISKQADKLVLQFKGIDVSYVNTLRRLVMEETPIMAIDELEIRKNNSILYDEMLSHRLGLLPITTDPKGYELKQPEEPLSAKNSVQLVLKAKGPGIVYASQLKSKDPKIVPVEPKSILVNLLEGQEVELIATAVLGKGRDHSKWSGCLAYYAQVNEFTFKDASILPALEKQLPSTAKITKKGDKVRLDSSNPKDHDLLLALADDYGDKIKAEPTDEYVFALESWGSLSPKEIVVQALKQFDLQLDEITTLSKSL